MVFLLHTVAGILTVSSQEDIGFTGWNTPDATFNLINFKKKAHDSLLGYGGALLSRLHNELLPQKQRFWECSAIIEYLPKIEEALGLMSASHKPGKADMPVMAAL